MNWDKLISLLIEFFGEILRAWLLSLFTKARARCGPYFPDTASAIEDLFAEARREVWWWEFRKRAKLSLCERVALNHASQFAMALSGIAPPPQMTAAEAAEIAAAL